MNVIYIIVYFFSFTPYASDWIYSFYSLPVIDLSLFITSFFSPMEFGASLLFRSKFHRRSHATVTVFSSRSNSGMQAGVLYLLHCTVISRDHHALHTRSPQCNVYSASLPPLTVFRDCTTELSFRLCISSIYSTMRLVESLVGPLKRDKNSFANGSSL